MAVCHSDKFIGRGVLIAFTFGKGSLVVGNEDPGCFDQEATDYAAFTLTLWQ
jgi:hypothetical protein